MESDDLSIRPVTERMEPVSRVPAAQGQALPANGQDEERRRPPREPPSPRASEENSTPDSEANGEIQPHRVDNLA